MHVRLRTAVRSSLVHNSCELPPATVISSMRLSGGRARQVIFGSGVCVMKGGCNASASPSTTVGESMACLLVPGQPGVRAGAPCKWATTRERSRNTFLVRSVRQQDRGDLLCAGGTGIQCCPRACGCGVHGAIATRRRRGSACNCFRYSTCENSRQRYERFPRAETDPRRRVAPKKESLCMADRNAVAGTIDTRFFSVARSPVNCACTFAPRKRRRRGSARNFFSRFKGNCAKWASAHADGYDSASFSPTTASCSSPSRSTKMRCGHPATS